MVLGYLLTGGLLEPSAYKACTVSLTLLRLHLRGPGLDDARGLLQLVQASAQELTLFAFVQRYQLNPWGG